MSFDLIGLRAAAAAQRRAWAIPHAGSDAMLGFYKRRGERLLAAINLTVAAVSPGARVDLSPQAAPVRSADLGRTGGEVRLDRLIPRCGEAVRVRLEASSEAP